MGEHDMLGNRKSEAGSARFAGARLVNAVKALEQAWQVFGGNARAEVLHIKLDYVVTPACT